VLAGVVAAVVAAVAAPASAAQARRTELPLLPSGPAPAARPQAPAGDFSYLPGPSGLSLARPQPAPASFDPDRSFSLEDPTTETRRVGRNADATYTTRFDAAPVRHQVDGRWVEDDVSLQRGGDGRLQAKAAPSAAVFAQELDAATATVQTPAGPVTLRHRGLLAGAATLEGATARFASAVPGGREATFVATRDGFEQTVVLADRRPGPSYRDEVVVPESVAVRPAPEGLEFVDASGAVLGYFGGGVAHDAAWPQAGPAAATPVELRVVDRVAGPSGFDTIVIEASVDAAWFHSASRVMPITLDPTWLRQTSQTGAFDTWVSSGANADTSFWSNPWLVAGSVDGVQLQRSYARFDLSGIPSGPDFWVSDATLWLTNWYSPSCTPQTMNLYRLLGPVGAATTWNNRPTPEATTVAASGPVAAGATGCPANWVTIPATPIAQDWLRHGQPNHGVEVRAASETSPANYRAFYSREAAGAANAPTLYITWNRQPPATTLVDPAGGAVVPTVSPTLKANKVADPDGDTVKYFFRATTGADAESGYVAVSSGWITPSGAAGDCPATGSVCGYTVPAGLLQDGRPTGGTPTRGRGSRARAPTPIPASPPPPPRRRPSCAPSPSTSASGRRPPSPRTRPAR